MTSHPSFFNKVSAVLRMVLLSSITITFKPSKFIISPNDVLSQAKNWYSQYSWDYLCKYVILKKITHFLLDYKTNLSNSPIKYKWASELKCRPTGFFWFSNVTSGTPFCKIIYPMLSPALQWNTQTNEDQCVKYLCLFDLCYLTQRFSLL